MNKFFVGCLLIVLTACSVSDSEKARIKHEAYLETDKIVTTIEAKSYYFTAQHAARVCKLDPLSCENKKPVAATMAVMTPFLTKAKELVPSEPKPLFKLYNDYSLDTVPDYNLNINAIPNGEILVGDSYTVPSYEIFMIEDKNKGMVSTDSYRSEKILFQGADLETLSKPFLAIKRPRYQSYLAKPQAVLNTSIVQQGSTFLSQQGYQDVQAATRYQTIFPVLQIIQTGNEEFDEDLAIYYAALTKFKMLYGEDFFSYKKRVTSN